MLKVKIANNPFTQEQGLMYVEYLPEDEGMMFQFRKATHLAFWGLNTFIPLDIAFINSKNEIVKIAKIEPHSLSTVTSEGICCSAIEANAGFFEKNDIHKGDIISMKDDVEVIAGMRMHSCDYAVVSFSKGNYKESQKDFNPNMLNFKKSQMEPPSGEIHKPGEQPAGKPITENVNNVQLPVLDLKNLKLEDSFDEEQDVPVDENVPQEEPVEMPEETEQTEPEKKYPVFSSAFQATEWAQENLEVVRISYTTKHGRALVRDVEPHGKFHSNSTMREILVTFDETINDIRAFILMNISKWAFVGKKFEKKFIVKG